jgi:hypothetical protein
MAVKLGWFDGHDPRALVDQETVVAVRPVEPSETLVEFQLTFRPISQRLEFAKTNFGFLGVRVAKSISAHFGDGQLVDSEGRIGETAIFGKRATWMDYSGSVGQAERPSIEGITYFDHASNPGHPSHWHVREDGWMIAAACMPTSLPTTREKPLQLRYQLHAHGGAANTARANRLAAEFDTRARLRLVKSRRRHTQYELQRV